MAKRRRLDLIQECYTADSQRQVSPEEFKKLICDHCRNPECTRAKWGYTHFDQRIETQVDRLLINPQFSDLKLSKHVQISQTDFPDIRQKVERLIISAARNDWAPVEAPSPVVVAAERQFGLDDGSEDGEDASAASPEAQKAVNNAVRRLAQMRGKAVPEPEPEPPRATRPEPEPDEPDEPEDEMTEEERRRADRMDKEHGTNRVPPRKPQPPAQHPGVQQQNTQFAPMGGFVIDNRQGRQGNAKPAEPEPAEDPWAPRKEKVMKKGENTVVIGGGDKDE